MIENYSKGSATGGIHDLAKGKFTACTGANSKEFKTLKGAHAWLAKKGFTPTEVKHEKEATKA
jgi:hypothetical protein